MFWALLALYLFGSSGAATLTAAFDQAKAFIKTDIGDKARRTELLAIIEGAERSTKGHVTTGNKAVKELSNIADRYDAKTEDLQPVLEKFRADTMAYQETMVRYRFDLKARMSREEWSRVFPKKESSPAGIN